MKVLITILVIISSMAIINAQDPADGWMAYAVGSVPESVDRITRLEMNSILNVLLKKKFLQKICVCNNS